MAIENSLDDRTRLDDHLIAVLDRRCHGHPRVDRLDCRHRAAEVAAFELQLVRQAELFHQPHDAFGAASFEVIDRDFGQRSCFRRVVRSHRGAR
jgi:hypothetical protein